MSHWSPVSGEYALATGRDLRDVPAPLLYDVAVAALYRTATLFKEQGESQDHIDKSISDLIWEEETGLPAIARSFGPADGSGVPL